MGVSPNFFRVNGMQIRVNLTYISAERLMEPGETGPPQVQISTNVNIIGAEFKRENLVIPFIVTINYSPSIAQISMKGQAFISGEPDELKKIETGYKGKSPPSPQILQAITSASLIEATIISRSLNIPPPLPLPSISQQMKSEDKEKPSYVG